MKKVKNIYYCEKTKKEEYRTGFIFELEDGTKLLENSTSPIEPYSKEMSIEEIKEIAERKAQFEPRGVTLTAPPLKK